MRLRISHGIILAAVIGAGYGGVHYGAGYVKKEGKVFVSKPSGDGERAMSYVANSAADMVYMLSRWKKIDKYHASGATWFSRTSVALKESV